jgi:hypothetical protein
LNFGNGQLVQILIAAERKLLAIDTGFAISYPVTMEVSLSAELQDKLMRLAAQRGSDRKSGNLGQGFRACIAITATMASVFL